MYPVASKVCNTLLKKVRFDEYSVTLSQQFSCRTFPWLHDQRPGVNIVATWKRSTVSLVRVKVLHIYPQLREKHGSGKIILTDY